MPSWYAVLAELRDDEYTPRDVRPACAEAIEYVDRLRAERDELRAAFRGLKWELLHLPPGTARELANGPFNKWFESVRELFERTEDQKGNGEAE
jgi:hypothetical protein